MQNLLVRDMLLLCDRFDRLGRFSGTADLNSHKGCALLFWRWAPARQGVQAQSGGRVVGIFAGR